MGRIVRGARIREERYALAVPEIGTPLAPDAGSGDEAGAFGAFGDGLDDAVLRREEAFDLEAARTEGAALLDQASREAERVLADAHNRARALVEDAAARADAIASEARANGHERGFAQGREAADREMTEMLSTMRSLLETARAERHKIVASAEPELVRLAYGIAARVLHQQVALDRGVVIEMAKSAIARLIDRDSVTVRVNPADLERIREHRDELVALGDIRTLRVIEDQRVDRGGIVVETEAGTIDARISTQLAEARKVLHLEDEIVVEPAPAVALPVSAEITARAS